ncbi:hypothetical protein OIU85_002161 [Salix viminalis]|uniref:Fe2OG dioxygenase domain-containing protein n=1 Tax=Salix viminalis TaxID=40686 RepID=A0A9Q0ZYU9_SALVM|nr:hypothetical protein OIU85_002161 [Salix viminalis]
MFEEGCQMMRMNYYPPCPQPELVIGLDSHSDAVGLTILLQVNEMEGLQVRKSGRWIPVEPLPNAFVLNIGDMLEIVTNGIYRSTEHRAAVNSVKRATIYWHLLQPQSRWRNGSCTKPCYSTDSGCLSESWSCGFLQGLFFS